MGVIWTPNKKVFCPLCDEPFKKQTIQYQGKLINFYICRTDKVGIFPFDPMFDKWRDTDKVIPCPSCNNPMKWFGRMIDCYMKCECPVCGICVEKDSDMSVSAKDGVTVEDMIEPEPEVFDIQVPIDKLNLSPEKKAQLRKKIREKRQRDGQG